MSEKHSPNPLLHFDDFQLNEYLDGYLPENQTASLELHLETCPECAARFDALQLVFASLETLPEIALERDLSPMVVSALQPQWKLSQRWKWGALTQFVLAVIVILLALPPLLKNWQPLLQELQLDLASQISERWFTLIAEWSTQFSEFQLDWTKFVFGWNAPTILETTQIVVWPLFLTAILLFVIGNGLILRKISRNGLH